MNEILENSKRIEKLVEDLQLNRSLLERAAEDMLNVLDGEGEIPNFDTFASSVMQVYEKSNEQIARIGALAMMISSECCN